MWSPSPVPNLVPLIEGAPRIIAAKQELPNLPPDGRVDTLVHRYKHTGGETIEVQMNWCEQSKEPYPSLYAA